MKEFIQKKKQKTDKDHKIPRYIQVFFLTGAKNLMFSVKFSKNVCGFFPEIFSYFVSHIPWSKEDLQKTQKFSM